MRSSLRRRRPSADSSDIPQILGLEQLSVSSRRAATNFDRNGPFGSQIVGLLGSRAAIRRFVSTKAYLSLRSLRLPRPQSPSRQGGRRPQLGDQRQDFPEHLSRNRDLGRLERDVAAVADDLGTDLDQLLVSDHGSAVLGIANVRMKLPRL